jgi:hypothetical protein
MLGLVFTLAFALVASLVARRWYVVRRRQRIWARRPGFSSERPVAIRRYDELDEHTREARCSCGGTLRVRSEGGASTPAYNVRVVHTECARCEHNWDLFYDLSHLVH